MSKQVLETWLDGEWREIVTIDTNDPNLPAGHDIGYYMENWYPPAEFRMVNGDGVVVSSERKEAVCMTCRQKKYMPADRNQCWSCLSS
jgi:hypothetical protein